MSDRLRPSAEAMVDVPGGRIYARVHGALDGGLPPLLLIHGGPGGSHWSMLNAIGLADERAVILYDQLDGGRSDRPGDPANWTIPRFLAEIEAIRAHFGVARWHVLGASWGGTLALEYGATRPPWLAGLVLQSPLVSTALWLDDARRLKAAMPPADRALLDGYDDPAMQPTSAHEAAMERFTRAHVRRADPDPELWTYRQSLPCPFNEAVYAHVWGRAEFSCTGTLRDYDGVPLLGSLDGARTLFIAGEHDEATPATVAGFAARVPGARFVEIAGATHMILVDDPGALLGALRPWLREQDAA